MRYYDKRNNSFISKQALAELKIEESKLSSFGIVPVKEQTVDTELVKVTGFNMIKLRDSMSIQYHTEDLPDEDVIPVLKERKLKEINNKYTEVMAASKTNIPEDEILTWSIQRAEVNLWKADNNSLTPFCDNLASQRGMEREEFLLLVARKIAEYDELSSITTGKRQTLEKEIEKASTKVQVAEISWNN